MWIRATIWNCQTHFRSNALTSPWTPVHTVCLCQKTRTPSNIAYGDSSLQLHSNTSSWQWFAATQSFSWWNFTEIRNSIRRFSSQATRNERCRLQDVFRFFNTALTAVFTVESLLKILAFGVRNYFIDGWNRFDFITVVGSITDALVTELGRMLCFFY